MKSPLSTPFFAMLLIGWAAIPTKLPGQSQYDLDRIRAAEATRRAQYIAAEARAQAQRAAVASEAALARLNQIEQREQQSAAAAAAKEEAIRQELAAAELARRQAEYKAAIESRVKAATERERAARMRPPGAMAAGNVATRTLDDGRVMVVASNERLTFPDAKTAAAFVENHKARAAQWATLTEEEQIAAWKDYYAKKTAQDFPWTKDASDPRSIKMAQINTLFSKSNNEYVQAVNYSYLLAGEAQRQCGVDSARNP